MTQTLNKKFPLKKGITSVQQRVLEDYLLACQSREVSLIGRKEVFKGKAKFGIFGDGKEVAQLALAKIIKNGDFRSGYYRDQTLMFALGVITEEAFFSQLYAHTDIAVEPSSGGRSMVAHFATRILDEKTGQHINLLEDVQVAADMSSTGSQIPRALGLAYASKLYRENPELSHLSKFSKNGDEITFVTIGNGACAEGIFFEMVNAIAVLQGPAIISIWDDEYAISTPNEYQMAKSSVSEALKGFQREKNKKGVEIFKVKGWDYNALIEIYKKAEKLSRKEHIPVIVHVYELTQPQGHSTSGSHERYKSKARLDWEKEFDCNIQLRKLILKKAWATEKELKEIEQQAKQDALRWRDNAWEKFRADINKEEQKFFSELVDIQNNSKYKTQINQKIRAFKRNTLPTFSSQVQLAKEILRITVHEKSTHRDRLLGWLSASIQDKERRYSSALYMEKEASALNVEHIPASLEGTKVDGYKIIQSCFDHLLARDPRVFIIGEDVGKIGDVNQGCAGLQEKYGELRVGDTGIREATILGQGIGAALRGLRPIVEIQYLDYIYFALQTIVDDLSNLHYRTAGGQAAPVIIRTRGHRLEGIWHSGSPMGVLIHAMRGVYIGVPRNMTQAAGMYNTLMLANEPALIIETLNAYRTKEYMPNNMDTFTVPMGVPEILMQGTDISVITYGAMCKIAQAAAKKLQNYGISVELIDVQTLLPFDIHHSIKESVKKTNRVLFLDEDVPGGASAYMMQKVVDEQDIYPYLDSKPSCLSAKAHRPAYADDGDYFSKPNMDTVFDAIYDIVSESNPTKYPNIY